MKELVTLENISDSRDLDEAERVRDDALTTEYHKWKTRKS